ncbi:hypothetical protein [Labedaea rhizosphaerae]|uniref:hypothetical protein n=1 Tax=Labedaea rhizosphaerae TaxID=598644 RepID=UPI00105C697D|nr:hypothetical protein [Labedaea rhizosphaerae]
MITAFPVRDTDLEAWCAALVRTSQAVVDDCGGDLVTWATATDAWTRHGPSTELVNAFVALLQDAAAVGFHSNLRMDTVAEQLAAHDRLADDYLRWREESVDRRWAGAFLPDLRRRDVTWDGRDESWEAFRTELLATAGRWNVLDKAERLITDPDAHTVLANEGLLTRLE